jgi:transposase-like protein
MYRKYTPKEKIEIVEGYINGQHSLDAKAHELGYKRAPGCFLRWVKVYQEHGPMGLFPSQGNNIYTKEFKIMVVEEYTIGAGSAFDLAAKYKISNADILLRWVEMYNANRELKDYCPKREVYMAEARRKTTIEERKEIVKYCIAHNRDYKGTASTYDVSYSQVYSWVKKYDANGEEGLLDKRGHRKTDDEVDELERLRRENLRLKRKLQESEMANQLLKKVREFEGK